jgi:hypothetical protein
MTLVLALHQRNLRSKLNVDHHADAAIQLKKGRRLLSGQNLSNYRHILLAKLRSGDVRVQPAANETVGLLIGQRSVAIGILLDDCGSSVVDLSVVCRILLVHGPELRRFAVRESQICGDKLLLDRTDILA